jgi:hypothetical protein
MNKLIQSRFIAFVSEHCARAGIRSQRSAAIDQATIFMHSWLGQISITEKLVPDESTGTVSAA